MKSRLRHYTNISKMFGKVERLLKEFTWKRIDEIYPVTVDRVAT